MKRMMAVVAVLVAIAAVGTSAARADHRSSGFGGGCGPSRGYSSRSYDSFGGYGGGSFGAYGYGGDSRGWSGSSGRGSSHYNYQPTQIQIHRGHIDVQAGHYDRHSLRHWGW